VTGEEEGACRRKRRNDRKARGIPSQLHRTRLTRQEMGVGDVTGRRKDRAVGRGGATNGQGEYLASFTERGWYGREGDVVV